MSRCVLDNEETGDEVVIGWDPRGNTFFAQVIEPGAEEPTLWLGTVLGEFDTPDELIAVVIPYACKCNRDVLAANLYLDQQNNSERIYSIDGNKVWGDNGQTAERLTSKGEQAIELGDYNGQDVDDLLLEKALDFMISIEPAPESYDADEYRAIIEVNKNKVAKAEAIMRKYGEAITPLTLETMQDVFYDITNSDKYGSDSLSCSVVRSCLTEAWHGIGGWMK